MCLLSPPPPRDDKTNKFPVGSAKRRRIFNYRPPKMITPSLKTAVLLRALLSPFRSPHCAIRSDFYCALEKLSFPADYIRPRHVITGYNIIVISSSLHPPPKYTLNDGVTKLSRFRRPSAAHRTGRFWGERKRTVFSFPTSAA